MYGGEKQLFFYVEEIKMLSLISSLEPLMLDIDVNGKIHRCIIQEIQFHPVTDRIIHIDFVEIKDDKPITMNVPVKFEGDSIGIKRGGKLDIKLKKLPVKAIPSKMPSYIPINITKLDIGDSIRVRDISNDDYQILKPPHLMIAKIIFIRTIITQIEEDTDTEELAETDEVANETE